MSALIIYEDHGWKNFLPLVYWRPVQRLRCGRYPLMERIRLRLNHADAKLWVRPELEAVVRSRHSFAVNQAAHDGDLLVNARWLPEGQPEATPRPSVGMLGNQIAFIRCDDALANQLHPSTLFDTLKLRKILEPIRTVDALGWMFDYPWNLIHRNSDVLMMDWEGDDGTMAGQVHLSAHLLNQNRIHVGEGSVIKPGAVLDAEAGPIYIDEHVTILPNAVIQGPSFIGEYSVINAGAWIRGGVSIGPHCRVGGEVVTSILHALSNKQHYGFLGHSYVAEWANLGAGSTTSNLKNTYGTIKVPILGVPVDSGQMFLGSIIGDFVKIGINQSLTTGSSIGFASQLATSTLNQSFIPSFCFMTDFKNEPGDVDRCLKFAERAMTRRNLAMTEPEKAYFRTLFDVVNRLEQI